MSVAHLGVAPKALNIRDTNAQQRKRSQVAAFISSFRWATKVTSCVALAWKKIPDSAAGGRRLKQMHVVAALLSIRGSQQALCRLLPGSWS